MACANLLLDLVKTERRGDRNRFRVNVEAAISEERANQYWLLTDRLSELVAITGQGAWVTLATVRHSQLDACTDRKSDICIA